MPRRIVVATSNPHKLQELTSMLARARFPEVRQLEIVSVAALPEYGKPPEIEETEITFVGNAVLKAAGIAQWLRTVGAPRDELVLADDSGLCVDAFDGKPGVYSARFAGPNANDERNNAKLVAELTARGLESSPAEYVCVLAIRQVGTRPFDFTLPDAGAIFMRENCLCIEGRCRGNVRVAARGDGGFGYDPHFWIDGDTRTFAELSRGEKSQRSHRGAAGRRLVQELPLILQ
ncbi:Nucleoside 5-triphosphatase RdgB (dHAPTP, dITP, XTP-specific) [Enhygromyxa salina]|uniref:dITP/XTP pyrophosphatase n=1 Tax=Enhygromyxa salina TaxID=215803 RepID=A0A0C2D2L2_9BACT|nr:non-canonical purine NTP pyrophosphatase [Enhygromyxa salina]KIG16010.1 Nucleoside 5-triphosphatase RdgB (dHAPTP, dITP, XTP-specific) [Enhygromyxa salina]